MAKILKATISGSFIAGDKETESYSEVTGYLPALDDDKAQQMINKRYAKIWLGQEEVDGKPKYKRVSKVRECFIDSIEIEEGKQLSYVGKSIMDMNFEELQDLAAAKDLVGVPLYKTGSLTQARRVAFSEYAITVLDMDKKDLDWRLEGFSPAKYPAIIADGTIRRSGEVPADLEESIDREVLREEVNRAGKTAPDSRLTLEQLKAIAKGKGIEFSDKIGYDALFRRVYRANAA